MIEVAERCGIPVPTAYKWRARALAALMKVLDPVRG
jgi:DNA-directed RNA polymerase specialized sigma24 family protein